jgi:hypothetical protein
LETEELDLVSGGLKALWMDNKEPGPQQNASA